VDVSVVTGDLIFFSAVEGIVGAMGHSARQAAGLTATDAADLVVLDFASMPGDAAEIMAGIDPLRAAAFIPHVDVTAFAAARASGIAHVHRRGALAVELPRILSLYAGQLDWGIA
jgi:hypothetical protein